MIDVVNSIDSKTLSVAIVDLVIVYLVISDDAATTWRESAIISSFGYSECAIF